MNIHEHQAKEILKKYGAQVPNGVVILDPAELNKKIGKLNSTNIVVKAQIHAGGRGKAGGIKLTKNFDELRKEVESMYGKILITHQTGSSGTKVKRLYLEEACDVQEEFYLSCLIDRSSSKIALFLALRGVLI